MAALHLAWSEWFCNLVWGVARIRGPRARESEGLWWRGNYRWGYCFNILASWQPPRKWWIGNFCDFITKWWAAALIPPCAIILDLPRLSGSNTRPAQVFLVAIRGWQDFQILIKAAGILILFNPSDAEFTFVQSKGRKDFWKTSKPCRVGIH